MKLVTKLVQTKLAAVSHCANQRWNNHILNSLQLTHHGNKCSAVWRTQIRLRCGLLFYFTKLEDKYRYRLSIHNVYTVKSYRQTIPQIRESKWVYGTCSRIESHLSFLNVCKRKMFQLLLTSWTFFVISEEKRHSIIIFGCDCDLTRLSFSLSWHLCCR